MKLESTHKFPDKTYWLFTFNGDKSLSACIYEPVYDDGLNTITGLRVATDGLDIDGEYEIKIDLDNVRSFERIGPGKLEFINAISSDNCSMQRIVSACNLKQQLEVGKNAGVIHKNAEQTNVTDTEESSKIVEHEVIDKSPEPQVVESKTKGSMKISAPGT